jgi:glycosyltransferase involved in cell wall biosynthesis
MRVLWVSPHCWPDYVLREDGLGTKSQGGQTVVMYHCPRALAGLDPDLHVDIYARMETGEPEVVELGERVNLIRCRCGDPGVYVPKEDFWSGPIQEFVEEVALHARRHGHAYDLIHGHYADGWYAANHLAQRWGCPFVLTTHSLGKRKRENSLAMNEGTEAQLDEKYAFSVRIAHETEALGVADRICPLTHEEGQYILEHYEGVDRDRIHSVPNGILLSEFEPRRDDETRELRRRLGIGEDELVVLQIGRVDRRKGQKQLLTAAPRVARELQDRTGRRVRLLFVGWTESDYARSLAEEATRSGIMDHVILHPPVINRDIPPYYWLADVYALTSTYDILPIVVLEAMACRLTLVASKNGGASEIIDHGQDGILIDPFDREQTEDALIEALADDAARQRWGEAAYRKVEQHFTWQRVAERFRRLYDEVLRSRAQ